MNIFATSMCPHESALFLDDKRVRKMIVESAQILSTAVLLKKPDAEGIYKKTHKTSKLVKWAGETRNNYTWLLLYAQSLVDLYGHHHKTAPIVKNLYVFIDLFPEGNLTPFINMAENRGLGISFTHIEDTHEAYKLYLQARWQTDKHKPTFNYMEKTRGHH